MAPGKNGFGFGLGLGGLLLIAAAPWLDIGLHAIPHFLEGSPWAAHATVLGLQIGLSGLVAGWFTFEATRRIARGVVRVAAMTLLAVVTTAALSVGFSRLAGPIATHVLLLYFLILPVSCFVAVPLWAAIYLRLIQPQESFEQTLASAQKKESMARLLEDLHNVGPADRS